MTASTAHDCKAVRGGRWYMDQVSGFLACRTCNQLSICLNHGHDWVQSPLLIGVLWCSRCHVTDGMGITATVG